MELIKSSLRDSKPLIGELILKTPVARALSIVGDRWTLLVLLWAVIGVRRFETWRVRLGIAPGVLSNRLSKLVEHGLLRKVPVGQGKQRLEYRLTDKGSGLFQWALAVRDWQREWLHPDGRHPVTLRHSVCGHEFEPRLLCLHCEGPVRYQDIGITLAQGLEGMDVAKPMATRRGPNQSIEDGDTHSSHLLHTVDIIGDRWNYLILAAAYLGLRKFDDFETYLRIAPNVLADRLRTLEKYAMLAKSLYVARPPRYEYILTEKSQSFFPVVLSLGLWSEQWLYKGGDVKGYQRMHLTCGEPLRPAMCCDHCNGVLEFNEIEFLWD